MPSPDNKQELPSTAPANDSSTPTILAIVNSSASTPSQPPSRIVSSSLPSHQQDASHRSADTQPSNPIPTFRDQSPGNPHHVPASPVFRLPARSANISPGPRSRPASPQIATKFIKASETGKAAVTQSPLRKTYTPSNKANQENSPPVMEHQQDQQTLYRPKSKLRLRLKLTAPHPEGVKVEEPPVKPSLKVKLLSASNRNNEQPMRQHSHQQQTSVSTIRAYSPSSCAPSNASVASPTADTTSKAPNHKFINYFPTHFNSGSPRTGQEADEQDSIDKQREEREQRTLGWFPPAKAIPRSRSAWNLRVDEGKAAKSEEIGEGRFESDFDGRDVRDGEAANYGRTSASDRNDEMNCPPEFILTAASSTLAPEGDSGPYLKAVFGISEASLSPREPYDSAQSDAMRYGTPQPYDALAVITANHPNNSSTSTVNLTLTDSERSSSPRESASPSAVAYSPDASEIHGTEFAQKQPSPASVVSSSPFTLDKSMRSRMESPGDWVDTSLSYDLRSHDDSFTGHGVVTPQKSNPHREHLKDMARTPSKSDLLSPYAHGIAMDAVNAWSPSKAFAETDRKAGLVKHAPRSETDHSTLEGGEEVLNDSYGTDMSGDTSALVDQTEWKMRPDDGSSQGHASKTIRHAHTADGQDYGHHVGGTPSKEADTSLESGYTASLYTTPPKVQRKKTPDARRKEKEANGEVSNDIFSLSDQMLSDRYKFVQEIGFGNWGSVWQCKPRTPAAHPLHRSSVSRNQPSLSHAVASQHHPTKVAIKLVHRSKQATTAARVRALWSEMKIVRTLKADPHPNIIGFDSFIITPSYALIIMPFLAQLMPVSISEERAKGYFMQLTSALAYLHDNGVTHNDIKPSNIMLSCTNTPIFVDFGFAQKWDVNAVDTGANTLIGGLTTLTGHNASCHELFQSEISWGTPEYLDPQRAKGLRHDERASDVWALGVTFFEILIGRTPFEESEDEQFSTTEQLSVYHDRTVQGKWLGEWSMSSAMKALLQSMIQPDPVERITAREAHRHRALAIDVQVDMSTPPFVRTAASLPIEPKEKKQVPREKRDQKRSQALQAETGAKFIKADNKTKVQQVENATDFITAAHSTHDSAKKPLTRVSPAASQLETTRKMASIPVDQEGEAGRGGRDADVKNASQVLPNDTKTLAATNAPADPDSKLRDDLGEPKPNHLRPLESTVPIKSPRQKALKELRRPASAAALRNVDRSPSHDKQYVRGPSPLDQMQQSTPVTGQPDGLGRVDSHYYRHTRIASESGVRLLNNAFHTQNDTSERARPKSQLSFTQLANKDDIRRQADRIVRFDGENNWNTKMHIPQTSEIKDELADLRNAATSADLDAKLDRIALWVEDVEHIVEEAKYALKAVQAERPPSRQLLRQLELDQQSFEGHRRSVHIVRPPSAAGSRIQNLRRPSSSMHIRYESNFELAPVVQTGGFKPTHLRRQRSDLTNFRSRADPDIEELRRRDYELRGYDEWPEAHTKADFAKKLKTYRSTGDLHRLADLRKKEHEKVLDEIERSERNDRATHGWYQIEGRKAYLVQEHKKGPQESRLKSMFHSVKSIFKRRE